MSTVAVPVFTGTRSATCSVATWFIDDDERGVRQNFDVRVAVKRFEHHLGGDHVSEHGVKPVNRLRKRGVLELISEPNRCAGASFKLSFRAISAIVRRIATLRPLQVARRRRIR